MGHSGNDARQRAKRIAAAVNLAATRDAIKHQERVRDAALERGDRVGYLLAVAQRRRLEVREREYQPLASAHERDQQQLAFAHAVERPPARPVVACVPPVRPRARARRERRATSRSSRAGPDSDDPEPARGRLHDLAAGAAAAAAKVVVIDTGAVA